MKTPLEAAWDHLEVSGEGKNAQEMPDSQRIQHLNVALTLALSTIGDLEYRIRMLEEERHG